MVYYFYCMKGGKWMKKVLLVISMLLIASITAFFGFSNERNNQPQTFYQVYLDGELIGNIDSQKALEKYINNTQSYIKEKYNVDEVYAPKGLEIKKIVSFKENIMNVEDIYQIIQEKRPFTIKGYEITVFSEESKQAIYVIDERIYRTALEDSIKTFVGTEAYNAYINNTQTPIEDVGTYINNVYIENQMTIKETNIPVDETIYANSEDLTKYLLFGTTEQQKIYNVKLGDTLEQVAFNHEINVEELLISNPQFKNANALLYPGLQITIGILNPQIKITVEQEVVEDVVDKYKTIEEIDETLNIGVTKVKRDGEDGLIRVNQYVKITNGTTVYVNPRSKVQLKPTVNKIVIKGGKVVHGVGSGSWVWPTESGWRITSNYGYRINPITGMRELHGALDIAGTGYGSEIYAANSGVVETRRKDKDAGNYIIINHNNGYWTQYNHMSRFHEDVTVGAYVEKGQVIGYVGMTGQATGPHLHFAVWYGGKPFTWSSQRVNPWNLYR
ncbi:MAG: M23 family metallopeptidase [Firmicutes bacterium]|nr:M23 family metallopeptidase [Bacillota bacterium]